MEKSLRESAFVSSTEQRIQPFLQNPNVPNTIPTSPPRVPPPPVMMLMQIPNNQQPTQQPKKSSCCMIFTSILTLVVSAGLIGGGAYIAAQGPSTSYHYAILACGSLSFVGSIIAIYAGQDVGQRQGWIIATSTFAVIGLFSCSPAAMISMMALNNLKKDCYLPKCEIKPKLELSLKNFDASLGSCTWLCFENYETIWKVMGVLASACAWLQLILLITLCCHCCAQCCCQKKSTETPVNIIGVMAPPAFHPNTMQY